MKMSSMGEKIVLSAIPSLIGELGRGARDWIKWKREQRRREKDQMRKFLEQQEKDDKVKAELMAEKDEDLKTKVV